MGDKRCAMSWTTHDAGKTRDKPSWSWHAIPMLFSSFSARSSSLAGVVTSAPPFIFLLGRVYNMKSLGWAAVQGSGKQVALMSCCKARYVASSQASSLPSSFPLSSFIVQLLSLPLPLSLRSSSPDRCFLVGPTGSFVCVDSLEICKHGTLLRLHACMLARKTRDAMQGNAAKAGVEPIFLDTIIWPDPSCPWQPRSR